MSSSAAYKLEEDVEGFKMPKFMIHPKSPFMFKIKMMRLCTKIYIGLIVPFRIPFEEKPHIFWLSWDIILNLILAIDIFINFSTAYEDIKGKIIIDRK